MRAVGYCQFLRFRTVLPTWKSAQLVFDVFPTITVNHVRALVIRDPGVRYFHGKRRYCGCANYENQRWNRAPQSEAQFHRLGLQLRMEFQIPRFSQSTIRMVCTSSPSASREMFSITAFNQKLQAATCTSARRVSTLFRQLPAPAEETNASRKHSTFRFAASTVREMVENSRMMDFETTINQPLQRYPLRRNSVC